MGRLEKIVVLTVLFLVAVVLGVALTPTAGPAAGGESRGPVKSGIDPKQPIEAPANQPERALNAVVDLGKPDDSVANAKTAPAANPNAPGETKTPAPNNGGSPAPIPTTPPPPAERPVAKFLMTTEGLEPSGAADTMFYAWKQGDTFAAIAQRYYGSKDKVTRLTKANEGRTEASMKVDERLWIPIAETSKEEAAAEGKYYVVKAGDMLSGISQQFYGTSKKWQKILDANRDTLSSPEKLRPGMKLRIPE